MHIALPTQKKMHFLITFVLTAVVTLPARGEQEKFFLRFLSLERPTQPKPWPVKMICYFHKKTNSMFWLEKLSLCPTHRQIWMWLPMTAQLRWSSSHSFPRTNNTSSFILIHVQACDILQRKKRWRRAEIFHWQLHVSTWPVRKPISFTLCDGSVFWGLVQLPGVKPRTRIVPFFFVEACDCLLYREE